MPPCLKFLATPLPSLVVDEENLVIDFRPPHFRNASAIVALLDTNLTKMCETRFVQRHDSILKFGENFQKITEGLGKILIDASFDTNTRNRALSLLEAVCLSWFLVATAAVVKVKAVTQPLSKILQKVQLCYAEATDCVEEVRNPLSSWQSDGNEWGGNYFSVFNTVQRYADIAGIEIKKPRCPSRLVYRSSFKDCTVKNYFSSDTQFGIPIWIALLPSLLQCFPKNCCQHIS